MKCLLICITALILTCTSACSVSPSISQSTTGGYNEEKSETLIDSDREVDGIVFVQKKGYYTGTKAAHFKWVEGDNIYLSEHDAENGKNNKYYKNRFYVIYTDGTYENVYNALEAGRICGDDLLKADIGFYVVDNMS